MVQFNFFRREVNCKIVYYGPGLSGKTTNLEMVYRKTPASNRGELTSIATEQDRTLFFDFMPIDLGKISGMTTKLRLFTVPGQVFYNSTRKLVLQGADGVIFVADSQKNKLQENLESLKNLEENLKIHKMDIHQVPLVIQWNKRDLPNALPIDELERKINYLGVPTFAGVACTGEGVFPTLKRCATLVLDTVAKQANATGQGGFAPLPTSGAPQVAFPSNPLGATMPAQPASIPAPIPAPTASGMGLSALGATGKGPVLRSPIKKPVPPSIPLSPSVPKGESVENTSASEIEESATNASKFQESIDPTKANASVGEKPLLFKKFKKSLEEKNRG